MKTIEEALKILIGEDKINEAIDLNKKYDGVFDAQGDIIIAQADNIKDLLDKITEKAEDYPSDIYSEVIIDNKAFIEELEGNVFQEFLNGGSDDYFAFKEAISITWVGLDGDDDEDSLFISFQKNTVVKEALGESVEPKGLMIWTKAGANDYHADWINVPANITLEHFKELLIDNGYEIHDYSEDDKAWWGDDTGAKFCIELGSAARWWRFSSLEGCMNWFKAGNANTFKNSGTDDILDAEVIEESFDGYLSFEEIFWGIYDNEFDLPFEKTVAYIDNKYAEKIWADEEGDANLSVLTETEKSDIVEHAKEEAQNWDNLDIFNSHARYKTIPEIKQQIESIFGVVNNKLHEELETEDAIDSLTEKYSDEELDDMIGNVYNIQKITNIFRRKKYDDKRLFAHTVCTNCGREKTVFLSNLVNDPDKYGSCICSDTNLDAKLDAIDDLYSGRKKLASNTSGYTGVSFVKTYKGEPYNKWRAYIEVDGVRTYLGDFTSKSKAIKARKEAGEKGIKWYKDNRNKLMRDIRRKSKKYKNSKYRETQKTRSYAKLKKK